jgi:hypothetical protein
LRYLLEERNISVIHIDCRPARGFIYEQKGMAIVQLDIVRAILNSLRLTSCAYDDDFEWYGHMKHWSIPLVLNIDLGLFVIQVKNII